MLRLFESHQLLRRVQDTLRRHRTAREQIWHKGATSGDVLDLVEVAVNCEQNSLIYKVRKAGTGVCHTKDATGQTRQTCYYRAVVDAETIRFI